VKSSFKDKIPSTRKMIMNNVRGDIVDDKNLQQRQNLAKCRYSVLLLPGSVAGPVPTEASG
jgi:hypothetical protein